MTVAARAMAARVIAADRLGLSDTDQVLEYNGCDLNADDFSTLRNAAGMSRITLGREILIINELDEMNRATQRAFRSWWDKHRSIELIATTNEPLERRNAPTKLLPAIVSRCECVKLGAPSLKDILPHVSDILKAEGVPMPPAQLKALLGTYNGDLRDAMRTVNRATMEWKMGAPKPPFPPLHAVP